jgi:hypothetical protein
LLKHVLMKATLMLSEFGWGMSECCSVGK